MSAAGDPPIINIPFRICLENGQNKFKIDIPRHYLDSETQYRFGFEWLTLTPEFYSQQALKHNMDPLNEGDRDVEYPFEVDFVFNENYLPGDTPRKYIQTTDVVRLGKLISDINTHFNRLKPTGSIITPVVLDWYMENWEESGLSIAEFHKTTAAAYYDKPYDATLHDNALPVSARTLKNLNPLLFPTTDKEEVLEQVRVRMTIAPNVRVAFSNELILKNLGFDEALIPERGSHKQISYINHLGEQMVSHSGTLGVKYETTEGRNSKITLYTLGRIQPARAHTVTTSRLRELDPNELVHDVSSVVEEISAKCNQTFELRFSRTTNRFIFVYPGNPATTVVMRMPPRLARHLGFPNSLDRIESPMQPDILKPPVDTAESERQARTLVFDIGMACVNLEDYFSDTTPQFASMSMASLQATYAGTLTTQPTQTFPSVHVTYFKPELEFSLFRFNESGKPIHLHLPCAAYVQGSLCGKSINRDVPNRHR